MIMLNKPKIYCRKYTVYVHPDNLNSLYNFIYKYKQLSDDTKLVVNKIKSQ